MGKGIQFKHRLASAEDIPEIMNLMEASIVENMKSFLSKEEIEAAKESMGLDRTLIQDQTYFVIEVMKTAQTVMVACGGWGKRKTLYGGDHTDGRDDRFSDPATDPARIRAMYTHPEWIRNGLGSMLLDLGEAAAREAGFKTIELGATIPGLPLYEKQGYKAFHTEEIPGSNGEIKTVIHMRKNLIK